jgi:hypothetical protein
VRDRLARTALADLAGTFRPDALVALGRPPGPLRRRA